MPRQQRIQPGTETGVAKGMRGNGCAAVVVYYLYGQFAVQHSAGQVEPSLNLRIHAEEE